MPAARARSTGRKRFLLRCGLTPGFEGYRSKTAVDGGIGHKSFNKDFYDTLEGMNTGSSAEPVIEVRDLRMRYGSVDVLRGVDFHIGRGEVVALLGPNGAGKTTT